MYKMQLRSRQSHQFHTTTKMDLKLISFILFTCANNGFAMKYPGLGMEDPMEHPMEYPPNPMTQEALQHCRICISILMEVKYWMLNPENENGVVNFLNHGCNSAFEEDEMKNYYCKYGVNPLLNALRFQMEVPDYVKTCQAMNICPEPPKPELFPELDNEIDQLYDYESK